MIKFMFDLDGTVTSKETLPVIAGYFQVQEQIDELTRETIAGNIPFIESFIRRVHIMKTLSVSKIDSVLAEVPLYPKLHAFMCEHAGDCVIVTGNLDCWIHTLAKKYGVRCYSSIAAVANDQVSKIIDILKKEEVVSSYQKTGHRVVFVGEGNNDMEAMRIADLSVAAGLTHYPAKSVLTVADYLVFNEDALCRLLNQLY